MDVIVLSEIKWSYMRTRKHYLLSRFPREWRIFFFEPFAKGRSNNIFPRRAGNVTYVTVPVLKSGTRSGIYNIIARNRAARSVLSCVTLICVRFWLAVLGARRPSFCYVSNVLFLPVARSLKPLPVFYDCNDDPINFPSAAKWVESYFDGLIALSDIVFACSRGLMKTALRKGAKRAVMVGNGVDIKLFAREIRPDEIPGDIRGLKSPVLGYTGTVSEWFDMSLVERLSREFPACSIAIVGPVAAAVRTRAKMLEESCPNVYFLGEKKVGDLSAYLKAMDVCMITFIMNEFTKSLNPNKVYEYLSAGKTVVSFNYSEDLEILRDFVYLAESEDEFVELVNKALSTPRDPEAMKKKAGENSWDRKADEMLAEISGYFSGAQ